MPTNFLTGIRRKHKTTTLEEFKGKRAEKINRLRKRDRAKRMRRATIKGEIKKKGLSPLHGRPLPSPGVQRDQKRNNRVKAGKLALKEAHSIRLLNGFHCSETRSEGAAAERAC